MNISEQIQKEEWNSIVVRWGNGKVTVVTRGEYYHELEANRILDDKEDAKLGLEDVHYQIISIV